MGRPRCMINRRVRNLRPVTSRKHGITLASHYYPCPRDALLPNLIRWPQYRDTVNNMILPMNSVIRQFCICEIILDGLRRL